MSFGKRQSGVGAAAPAFNVDVAAAQSPVAAENTQAKSYPFRSFAALVACGAMLYGLVVSYVPDLWRDHRLAGTWQPAYDLRAVDGKCRRVNFVVTFCSAKIKSVARPDQAPIEHHFFMLFTGGGGEALVPVRSTADRGAVSIYYAAEAKRWNRTLSFIFSAVVLAIFSVAALLAFRRSVDS